MIMLPVIVLTELPGHSLSIIYSAHTDNTSYFLLS